MFPNSKKANLDRSALTVLKGVQFSPTDEGKEIALQCE